MTFMPVRNPRHMADAQSVVGGNDPQHFTVRTSLADRPHLLIRDLHQWMTTAHRFVAHVVGVCAGVKVAWIATRRVIARMADERSRRDWAVSRLPRHAVSGRVLVFPITSVVHSTVTVDGPRSGPFPAGFRITSWNAPPETFGESQSHRGSHFGQYTLLVPA